MPAQDSRYLPPPHKARHPPPSTTRSPFAFVPRHGPPGGHQPGGENSTNLMASSRRGQLHTSRPAGRFERPGVLDLILLTTSGISSGKTEPPRCSMGSDFGVCFVGSCCAGGAAPSRRPQNCALRRNADRRYRKCAGSTAAHASPGLLAVFQRSLRHHCCRNCREASSCDLELEDPRGEVSMRYG